MLFENLNAFQGLLERLLRSLQAFEVDFADFMVLIALVSQESVVSRAGLGSSVLGFGEAPRYFLGCDSSW